MKLDGSCHCGAVRFSVESKTPYPYMRCYCSICRKTQGGGGYAINIMGNAKAFEVAGDDNIGVYQIKMPDGTRSEARRHFCTSCGSGLWLYDPRWPDWIYPFASAIDTPLPRPAEHVNLMTNYAPAWADMPKDAGNTSFPEYPEESIEAWHEKRGLFAD